MRPFPAGQQRDTQFFRAKRRLIFQVLHVPDRRRHGEMINVDGRSLPECGIIVLNTRIETRFSVYLEPV
jgi:hypothetical protein